MFQAVKLYLGGSAMLSAWRELAKGKPNTSGSMEGYVAVAQKGKSRSPMRLTTHRVYSLDDRMGYILRLTREGRNDARIRKLVSKILSRKCNGEWCIKEKDWDNEARAIFTYVKRSVRYSRDIEGKDTYQHPLRTLELGVGDCDDLSILIGAMLLSAGYPVKHRVIRTTSAKEWNHIFPLVGLPPGAPTRWLAMDACVSRPMGWHPPSAMIAQTKDFNV